jgi:predicted glycoside hydrolase/deacetylase ChbG (UPF0249 family)
MGIIKNQKISLWISIVLGLAFLSSCADSVHDQTDRTSAEKLGFPKGKRVIILHADDAGMCEEANISVFRYLQNEQIQSTSGMPPCEYFDEFVAWANQNAEKDMGLHLTLTSEWQNYRWGSVSDPKSVPGLIDPDGFLWHEVPDVVKHASAEEVEKEIRAQIDKAVSMGMDVDHIDTHMGTLYGTIDYAMAYMKVAQEYNIPAMVISLTDPEVLRRFQEEGYPVDENTSNLISQYPLPQLDDFHAVPSGKTYDEKIQNFFQMVKALKPGLTEIIFHPSVDTENLKSITNSWQQRVWEAEMFADPNVISFFEDEGIIFTNWKEIMVRHDAK